MGGTEDGASPESASGNTGSDSLEESHSLWSMSWSEVGAKSCTEAVASHDSGVREISV